MNSLLSLPSVTSFLSLNGWKKTSEIRGAFQIWHSDEFPSSEVTLTLDEDHKRYRLLLDDALEEISECLMIPVGVLIEQISPQNFDTISVRAIGDDVKHGSIPFDDGIKLLSSSHKLLKHCSNQVKRFKNKSKHLSNYLNHVGMGQTQIGSYIVSIHSPLYRVNTDDEPDLFDSDISLGRIINKSFYSKIFEVSSIFSKKINFELITQSLLEIGIDKKDCDALIDIMGSQSHRDIEINVNWSPKESIEERYCKSIHLYARNVQYIVDYREILKEKKVENNIQLSGEIADLHRGYDDELGKAKLRTKYQEKDISISFSVSDEQYLTVANAHVNKIIVTITGELEVVKVEQKLTAHFITIDDLSVTENLEIDYSE
ncbi:hypothetical protein Q4557_19550 [Shewanella sp. 5_MG-2023]|uniref:hypothetical protein n=1 Tax=Shewanella sp. 5_MG-2023 TaxID=3062656 RepID=UPI0026E3AB78|nr:hypothetical protein [Shewanella sp. 5_MG-2023]MDO6642145.1 hypothetical protein [Shewanella sp. 5_MG-2023]